MSDLSDEEMLAELGVSIDEETKPRATAREQRIAAGFEEIQRFVEEHGRLPVDEEGRDIFERLCAVRLERARELEECRIVLAELDHQGLLEGGHAGTLAELDEIDDEAMLAELGAGGDDLTTLRHVRPAGERLAAEEVARRKRCEDFKTFKPIFDGLQTDLDTGARETRPFELKSEIEKGSFFIVGGQKAYVAEKDEEFTNAQGMRDARLRVIFDNGTESNLLMRSLQRALHADEAGRRVTNPSAGPLFSGVPDEGDVESGTIYVLRSLSDLPVVAENRDVIHKIGVTGGKVEHRIAAAHNDATFLLAGVEIVATYDLYNISRTKLENLIHKFFAHARLDIEIKDRFGNPVRPREWFLVPFTVVDEAVTKIQDGTIHAYRYDRETASIVPAGG